MANTCEPNKNVLRKYIYTHFLSTYLQNICISNFRPWHKCWNIAMLEPSWLLEHFLNLYHYYTEILLQKKLDFFTIMYVMCELWCIVMLRIFLAKKSNKKRAGTVLHHHSKAEKTFWHNVLSYKITNQILTLIVF